MRNLYTYLAFNPLRVGYIDQCSIYSVSIQELVKLKEIIGSTTEADRYIYKLTNRKLIVVEWNNNKKFCILKWNETKNEYKLLLTKENKS